MNKLYSKIAALSVSLAMAVGVGVAVGRNSGTFKAEAKSYSAAYTLDCASASHDGTSTKYGGKTTVMTAAYIAAFVNAAAGSTILDSTNPVTGVSGSIYWAKGSGGSGIPDDCLKIGKSTAGGEFTLNLASTSKAISKVDIVGYGWKTTSAISVNGADPKSPAAAATEETFSFELDSATRSITFTCTTSAICATSIVLYEESAAVAPTSISCDPQSIIETASLNLNSVVTFAPSNTTEKGLSFAVKSGSDYINLNSETGAVTGVSVGTSVVTITPNNTSAGAEAIDVTINVTPLEILSVEKSGNYRTSFVEKQKLNWGTGKLHVTYNTSSTKDILPTAEGVTAQIGDTAISTSSYYLKTSDSGKVLKLLYGGHTVEIDTLTVTPYEEPEAGYWSPITSTSEIEVGMKVIFVASNHNYAMGRFTTGNNITAIDISKDGEGKISSSIPGVEIYTVAAGSAANTFAFKDSANKYIAATGGTASNKLTVEDDISSNGSFTVTISDNVMTLIGQEGNTAGRSYLRYNDNDIIFSCYGSSSSIGSLACLYKFTAQPKSADQIAVENFCNTSLKLDSTAGDYIDPNDNTKGTACIGARYTSAKSAYNALSAAQKEIFATSADTLIMWGRARLISWASANGEEFDPAAGSFTPSSMALMNNELNNGTGMIIIIAASVTSLIGFGLLLILKKRKVQK